MILIILLFTDLFQMMLTVIFDGTVIFTKMDDFGFASLSNNDIDIIRNHLCRLSDGLFEMSYSLKNSY